MLRFRRDTSKVCFLLDQRIVSFEYRLQKEVRFVKAKAAENFGVYMTTKVHMSACEKFLCVLRLMCMCVTE